MKKITRITIPVLTLALSVFATSFKTYAVCPVCTIAIAGGVGLSRWLGIDDVISGVWIGGLLVSSSMWMVNWLRSKKVNFKFMTPATLVGMYVISLFPLHYTKMLSDPYNTQWGVNKILLGTAIGTIIFFLSLITDKYLRKTNEGKVYVPYQKVILPVSYLLITSLIMYFFVL